MKTWILSALLGVMLAGAAVAEAPGATLSVVGEGRVAAAPDMAVISLGVVQTAPAAAAAMAAANSDAAALLGRLADLGVAGRDIQTGRFDISPLWDNAAEGRRITGYVARNAMTVRVRDLTQLGAILDGALAVGSNEFGGIRFRLADPSETQAAARAAAVRDGMARAAQLAQAAGLTLGPVRTMAEQGATAPRPEMFAAAASRAEAAIATGEVSYSARVTLTFDLLP